jgi:hypothetical protein
MYKYLLPVSLDLLFNGYITSSKLLDMHSAGQEIWYRPLTQQKTMRKATGSAMKEHSSKLYMLYAFSCKSLRPAQRMCFSIATQ